MADNAPVLLWLTDEHGNAFFFNSTLLSFRGRTMEQEAGRGWIEGLHPDDREAFVAKCEEGFAARVPFEAEVRLLHHSGEYCQMLCRHQPLFDAAGRFSGYAGSAFDISSRKRTEDERDEALALLNAIDLASPVGLAFYSTDFRLRHANPAYFEMFGFDPVGSIGAHVTELMGESRRARTEVHFEEILRGQRVPDFEVTTARPGRPEEIGTFLVSYYPVSAEGRTVGGIGVSVQDVTELRASQVALVASEARYRGLADTVPQMIWTSDANGRATWTNKRSSDYSGGEQESLGLGWIDMLHPDDSEAAVEGWNHSMATGEAYETEVRLRRHDGIYRWHVARAMPVHDADGAVVSWIGSSTDVDELRSGQARYRMLGDALPQMIWTAGPDGDVNYNNKRWFEYTGLTEEEGLHSGWETVMHPDDLGPTRERWQKALSSGESYETEFRLRREDGAYRWHIARAEPIYEHATLIAWFGTNTDIDAQKQAEAAVGELNRQLNLRLEDLETLLRVLPVGVAISHDPEARDIRMNEALANMLGMNKSDNGSLSAPMYRDSPPFRMYRNDDDEIAAEELVMQAAALGGTEVRDTYRVVRGDGTELEMLAFATPLKDGERTRGSIGAFVDVSEVKRTEQALLAAEGLYQAAGEAIPFGIWASDANGNPTYLSKSLLDFVGLTLREVQEGRMDEHIVGQIEGEPSPWMRRPLDPQTEWVSELEVRGSNGDVCTILSRGGPMRDHDGRLTGFAGINLDISRRKQVERDLAMTIEELQKANAVKDELLGLVSHELRTPLTTISGNAQALRRHGDRIDAETKTIALQDIENDAARLQRLIENMLVLARLEGASDFESEPVLLQRLLPKFADELGRRTHRSVTADVPADLAPASAQPVYVEQIIGNLVTNAVKYSPPGTAIDVRAFGTESHLTVLVEDRGQGITEDEASQVFAPFYRSQRTAKQASGIGLGLAVCKRLVEVQGGTIWATPREGGGTSVAFTLPTSREF
ncbi:MAG: PAS domain S-box protein [Tepidiformaceae bacterium]